MSEQHTGATAAALPPPPGLSIERIGAGDEEEFVLSFPLDDTREVSVELTAAERAVADGLLDGLTTMEIAQRRGVSRFTVANQIARIFAKLSVNSRLGLALVMRRAA